MILNKQTKLWKTDSDWSMINKVTAIVHFVNELKLFNQVNFAKNTLLSPFISTFLLKGS